ncbi:MAG TPA: hypothetical protein VE866_06025, partial [Candidatus Binatia bacterium]|nr:hypothetical protein [Candidatus Binatia bacterium]
MAALLVATVMMPGIMGFGQCCEPKPSSRGIVLHHACHEQMQEEVAPVGISISAKGCQCRLCPSLLARRAESQVPQIVFAPTSVQATMVNTSLAAVSARLHFYDDPP